MADKRLHHFQKEGITTPREERVQVTHRQNTEGFLWRTVTSTKMCDMCSISSSCSVVIGFCHVCRSGCAEVCKRVCLLEICIDNDNSHYYFSHSDLQT